jgi:hypothetical protein
MSNDKQDEPRQKNARLSVPEDRRIELLPWRRADGLERCFLYWLPVDSFPMPQGQREWLMLFLDRWIALLKEQFGLRPELFLQYKSVHPHLLKPLLNTMMDFIPVMGLGRKPGAPLPEMPSVSEIQATTKKMFDALRQQQELPLPDPNKHLPDYAYWFVDKSEKRQRETFFGFGGITVTFLKPDPKTVTKPLPISAAVRKRLPILQVIDVDQMMARAASLSDGFLAKSKEMFSAGLENEPQTKGLPFILPLMDAGDFFSQPPEVMKQCFELFDVYVRESPVDKGMLLAFESDMEKPLIALLKEMRDQGLKYPGTI